jgi:hypothetical protein
MLTLDQFFETPTEKPRPRLRKWEKLLKDPKKTATLEVTRSKGVFGPEQPQMNLQFFDDGNPINLESVPWEEELNQGLIHLKVRSSNEQNEAVRFSLGLQAAMRNVAREFSDSYMNAVLVELIIESDLTRYSEIADNLKHTHTNKLNREGESSERYHTCRDLIAFAISGRARELTRDLGYNQDEAKKILVSAIARYLDDRFSISTRREHGLL